MTVYRFEEIAHNISDKKMPVPGDEKTYIGLEHLDTGSLQVTRWGQDVVLTGEKLIMKKGDILFGRRNTYLRRAAIAPHDGIFSAHCMIFRPKTDVIDAEFFPFFISSDYFIDEAIKISVGSLSPTVNWGTLKKLEFDLPSMEEQKRLAKILIAAEETRQAYKKLIKQTDDLINAKFIELFVLNNSDECYKKSLQELIDKKWITYHLDGNHGGDYPRSDEFVESGVPYISANCIADGVVDMRFAKYVTKERAQRFRKGIAQNGDVLFAHNATVGPVALLKTTEPVVVLGTSLTAFRCDTKHIIPEYLMSFMKHPMFINQYESDMQQTTRKQVPITTQRKYNFIIPPVEKQKVFADFVQQAEQTKIATQQSLYALNETVRALVNRNFN